VCINSWCAVKVSGQFCSYQYSICTIYIRSSVLPLAFHLCSLTASLLATVYNIYTLLFLFLCVRNTVPFLSLFLIFPFFLHCLFSSLHRNLIFCFHNVFVYLLFLFLAVYLRTFTLWSCNSVTA